ncbi:hypothetical protein EAG_09806 [Camponotus floridanus]|uniref:Uncharacterized protein n=1 Tax=Camponotus floridanus TaxID=104421 RepID=E2AUT5_CAMFO|nr:hypothetical protein EAG_09806 [Camponotus floridanus]
MFLNNVDDCRRAIPSVEHRKVEGSLEDTSLFLRVHGRPVANEAALLICLMQQESPRSSILFLVRKILDDLCNIIPLKKNLTPTEQDGARETNDDEPLDEYKFRYPVITCTNRAVFPEKAIATRAYMTRQTLTRIVTTGQTLNNQQLIDEDSNIPDCLKQLLFARRNNDAANFQTTSAVLTYKHRSTRLNPRSLSKAGAVPFICLWRSAPCRLDVEDQTPLRANGAAKYIRTLVRRGGTTVSFQTIPSGSAAPACTWDTRSDKGQGKELVREDKHRGSDHVAKQSARLSTSVNHPADSTTNMQRKKLSSSSRRSSFPLFSKPILSRPFDRTRAFILASSPCAQRWNLLDWRLNLERDTTAVRPIKSDRNARASFGRVRRGGTSPFRNWSEDTPATVSNIDSIGKQLLLLCTMSERNSVRIASIDRGSSVI